jgi:fluoride exporter
MNWLAVMMGSAAGGALRYAVGGVWLRSAALGFPWGILVVNVTGSFALGFLARYFAPPHGSHTMFLFLTVGLCGGYTTFSTFTLDTFTLVQGGAVLRAMGYVLASVVLSYLALIAGYALARPLHPV